MIARTAATVAAATFFVLTAPVISSASALASEPAASVVIVGMPGLRWSDLSPETTPYLWELTSRSAVGQMSIRSAKPRTCPADGWVQLGTGNRARYPVSDDLAEGACQPLPPVSAHQTGGATVSDWSTVVDENQALFFGAEPGLLGQTLQDANLCTTAVADGAALAAANLTGDVDRWVSDPIQLTKAELGWCPLTVVAADPPSVDGDSGERRAEDLAAFDRLVETVDRERPEQSLMMVLGISDLADERGQLHLALAQGPDFDGGYLTSGSTRRAPFVQLSDVAPTVLQTLDLTIPSAMPYQPIVAASSNEGADRLARLDEVARRADVQGQLISAFFAVLVLSQALLYLAAFLTLRRHPQDRTRSKVLAGTHVAAVSAAAVPAATYLASVLPWWKSSHPVPALLGSIAVAAAALTLVSFAGPWRRHAFGPAGAVAAATTIVLAVDLLAGAPLQLASVAGYSPVVAGRFIGFGNLAFAIFGTAALLATAAIISGRSRRATTLMVIAGGVFAVVVDGLPQLGADFGGVLALVPAFGTLGWVATGRRLTWRPLALMFGAAVVIVAVIATVDYLRPDSERSHIGRFVNSVVNGDAGVILERKIDANWSLLTTNVLTLMVPLVIVFLIFLMRRPSGLLPWSFTQVPTLRAGLLGVLVLGVIGALVNDSGVAIPAMAATLAIPITVAVVVRSMRLSEDSAHPSSPSRVASPAEPPA